MLPVIAAGSLLRKTLWSAAEQLGGKFALSQVDDEVPPPVHVRQGTQRCRQIRHEQPVAERAGSENDPVRYILLSLPVYLAERVFEPLHA